MFAAQNIRALGHEMDAAKDDVAAVGFGGLVRKLQGVAAEIGELYDFIALVVMSQNNDVASKFRSRGADALVERGVWDEEVRVEVAAYTLLNFRRPHRRRLRNTDQVRNGDKCAHWLLCWVAVRYDGLGIPLVIG